MINILGRISGQGDLVKRAQESEKIKHTQISRLNYSKYGGMYFMSETNTMLKEL